MMDTATEIILLDTTPTACTTVTATEVGKSTPTPPATVLVDQQSNCILKAK